MTEVSSVWFCNISQKSSKKSSALRASQFGIDRPLIFTSTFRGGLDMLDLRHGTVLRTLIPKIAEGIFNVICKFNATNEYVLYYHSGRKTLRIFRVSDGVMIANYRVPSGMLSSLHIIRSVNKQLSFSSKKSKQAVVIL